MSAGGLVPTRPDADAGLIAVARGVEPNRHRVPEVAPLLKVPHQVLSTVAA